MNAGGQRGKLKERGKKPIVCCWKIDGGWMDEGSCGKARMLLSWGWKGSDTDYCISMALEPFRYSDGPSDVFSSSVVFASVMRKTHSFLGTGPWAKKQAVSFIYPCFVQVGTHVTIWWINCVLQCYRLAAPNWLSVKDFSAVITTALFKKAFLPMIWCIDDHK